MDTCVFVSYARRDWPFVRDLAKSLEEAGYETWVDLTAISAGRSWSQQIARAIERCVHFLVVVSPYSMGSGVVREEMNHAIRSGKNIVPVLLQRPNGLPKALHGLQWVDLRSNFQGGLRQLKRQLEGGGPSGMYEVDSPTRELYVRWPFRYWPPAYLPSPLSVRVLTILSFLVVAMISFVATTSAMIAGFQIPDPGLWLFVALAILGSLLAAICAYRAAIRKVTIKQMLAGHATALFALAASLFMLHNSSVGVLMIAPVLLQAGILLSTVVSKSYQRWMVAYAVGFGMEDGVSAPPLE